LFQKALGIYFYSDYYVAREETYKNVFVFYDRFVYDIVSMFGLHLFYIEIATLELLLRRIYRAVTFQMKGKVRLRRIEDIVPAFTEKEFEEALQEKSKIDQTLHLKIGTSIDPI
jgi:hypothetical protein